VHLQHHNDVSAYSLIPALEWLQSGMVCSLWRTSDHTSTSRSSWQGILVRIPILGMVRCGPRRKQHEPRCEEHERRRWTCSDSPASSSRWASGVDPIGGRHVLGTDSTLAGKVWDGATTARNETQLCRNSPAAFQRSNDSRVDKGSLEIGPFDGKAQLARPSLPEVSSAQEHLHLQQ
jgi:hypothetical protein